VSGAADERIAAWRQLIESELERSIVAAEDLPGRLREAMRYPLLAGGKRLRPLLTLAACESAGADARHGLPAALAVEMIHTYSLVHDDLPAMDDDDLRRGRPTCHVVFGEAMAILAGDALHTLAFETLAGADAPPARIARQVRTLAVAAGAAGMAGGQALDLLHEGAEPTLDLVERIHRLKTGALLAACFRLGAEAADAPAEQVARLDAIGRCVGLAFQIQDDILDETASTAELGKTAGKDRQAGKLTWPAAIGIEAARTRARGLLAEARAGLEALGARTAALDVLVGRAVDRRA
jgi:geranylgeranyl diphosphate synthase type II